MFKFAGFLGPETASSYYLTQMDKRMIPQPRGPLDDCKSYFECKSRFIKYLDGLARMGKMGRRRWLIAPRADDQTRLDRVALHPQPIDFL